jgi:hypothetical protein
MEPVPATVRARSDTPLIGISRNAHAGVKTLGGP